MCICRGNTWLWSPLKNHLPLSHEEFSTGQLSAKAHFRSVPALGQGCYLPAASSHWAWGKSNSCSLFCSFLLLTCSRVFHPFDRTLSPSSLRHLIYLHSANFPYAILPFALLFSLPVGKCLPEYGCACSHVCVCMWGPEGDLECCPQKWCPLPLKQVSPWPETQQLC